ncbi:hypothetical protein SDJN02_16428, partial [Cucurbita argyrosperma subsp. argyrosperma]
MQDKGRPLPKFGEWDVNNPASAEGFTVIFSKARNEKKSNEASGNIAAKNNAPEPEENYQYSPMNFLQILVFWMQKVFSHEKMVLLSLKLIGSDGGGDNRHGERRVKIFLICEGNAESRRDVMVYFLSLCKFRSNRNFSLFISCHGCCWLQLHHSQDF